MIFSINSLKSLSYLHNKRLFLILDPSEAFFKHILPMGFEHSLEFAVSLASFDFHHSH